MPRMTTAPTLPRRFGVAASKLHREAADRGLLVWAEACGPAVRRMGMRLHTVGRSHAALAASAALGDWEGLVAYPSGKDGGLMRLVSHVAGGAYEGQALDGIIYLIDPVDPSTLYPEALALKRQCVTHQKPFVSTVAGAIEWMAVESVHAGTADASARTLLDVSQRHLALIAHDALKAQMVDFCSRHFDLLSRALSRVATGTTGQRLNEMAWSRGWPAGTPWVQRYLSGPLGGDAQIAERVLDLRCDKVIFFEDPHVARQHEADIQLLERAVCTVTRHASCANSPAMAERWAQAVTRAAG
jgi:methylglyoxal synthase